MTFTLARPVPQAKYGTGISCRTVVRKDGVVSFVLTMTGLFQTDNFGKNIANKPIVIEIGRAADSGLMKLKLADDGESDLIATKSMKASARVKCRAWDTLGKEAHKTASCKLVDTFDGDITIRLPDWANAQSRMEAEFGLKAQKKDVA